jgi:hypothetical protein
MTKKHITHAAIWSRIFPVLGLATLGAVTTMEGVYVFSTASHHHLLMGVPSDGLGKLALGLAVSLLGFGGASVVGAKLGDDRKYVRKGAGFALALTFAAFVFSASNLSGYFAWTRQSAEVAALTESVRYTDAVADAKFAAELRAAGKSLTSDQYDRAKEVAAILAEATPPATADRHVGDWVKALLAHGLILGMASAFQMPARAAGAAKAKPKTRAKPKATNVVAIKRA